MQELIHRHHRLFGESDKAISRFVLEYPQKAAAMNIQELAGASLTSKSSVVRFSQKLGFSGFSEMRAYLRWKNGEVHYDTCARQFPERVKNDIQKTIEYFEKADLKLLYQAMNEAKKFFIIATGISQQSQAMELQRLLHLTGKSVQILPASESSNEYRRAVEMLARKDIIFLLSLSGENPGLKNLLEIPLLKGVKLVSVTNFKSNWLAQNADFRYYAASSQSEIPRNWWMQSSSSFFLLLEMLVFGYIEYQSEE